MALPPGGAGGVRGFGGGGGGRFAWLVRGVRFLTDVRLSSPVFLRCGRGRGRAARRIASRFVRLEEGVVGRSMKTTSEPAALASRRATYSGEYGSMGYQAAKRAGMSAAGVEMPAWPSTLSSSR